MKIGIHLHLYYLDQWEFFRNQLKFLKGLNKKLIITTSKSKTKEAKKLIGEYPCEIYGLENRGYDVAPFIFALNKLKNWKPDIVLKIQTKGNKGNKDKLEHNGFYYKNALEWRTRQVKGLLGSKKRVNKIIKKFNNKNIGVIGNYEFVHKRIEAWNRRKNLNEFAKKFNLNQFFTPFFSGTMFWCSWKLCKHLIKNLKFKDFETVDLKKGVKTKAHAFEYYINTIATSIGLEIRCIDDNLITRIKFLWKFKFPFYFRKLLRLFIKVKNHNNVFMIKLLGITIFRKQTN